MRCLILTPYPSLDAFRDLNASRWFLEGLDKRDIQWEIHQPWLPRPDLDNFDVVVCWTYYWRHHDYISRALEMLQRCEELGIPVINNPEHAGANHSFFLKTWGAHGIPCARCQEIARPEDISLDYPLILRRDGVHRGRDVVLVHDADEARRLIEARLADPRPVDDGGAGEPFDLAIEFIDTRGGDGFYRKWRSYVVGGRIIPRQMEISDSWLVNLGGTVHLDDALTSAMVEENQTFVHDGEPWADLLRRAAELAGGDIAALDYSRRDNGEPVFWEANRHFLMVGDKGSQSPEHFEQVTGNNPEKVKAKNLVLGLAIADLVLSRKKRSRGSTP